MTNRKIINVHHRNAPLQEKFSKELGISKPLAQVLINRGLRHAHEASLFLKADTKDLLDPYSFKDMHKAVELIRKAVSKREKVMVFGDYDADGITALALLKGTLKDMGADVIHYIPHRVKEGYGLNRTALGVAEERGVGLLITADCGINSHEQVRELKKLGITVVITDHHEPGEKHGLPCADAILNPKTANSGYKFRDLAGVGVAYKLCQALSGSGLYEELDLVALGTIADSVPLVGENRIIAKEGLRRLSMTRREGIKAIIEQSGIKNRRINSEFVSFILGPRINASGRIDTAEVALSLLMSRDKTEAMDLAKTIEFYNRQRQKIENSILEEAKDLIDKEINFKDHKIVVVAKEGWHTGVLGIVAAKLSEKFFRPTILISLTDTFCRGSGRSVNTFHLFNALNGCSDLLDSFGGHQHATGLVIHRENLEVFKGRLNRLVKETMRVEDLIPRIEVDMELDFEQINAKLAVELQSLEPFGTDNPEPLFYSKGLKLKSEPRLLSRDTLKFWATDGKFTYQAIGFGMGRFASSLKDAGSFDMVYLPRIDSWQGKDSLVLEAEDIIFR